MKRIWLALAAGIMVAAAPAQDVVAQGRGNGNGNGNGNGRDRDERYVDRRDRDRDWDRNRDSNRNRDRDWDRRERERRELEALLRRRHAVDYNYKNRKNAPPFCRDGRGHPTHGRAWCREKGYGLGQRDIWRNATWGNVVYRRPRSIHDGRMSRGTLSDILGAVLVGRFDSHGRSLGHRDPLYGRWFEGGTVLQISSGAYPIAQVIDRNRDGRPEAILLYGAR